MIKLYLFLFLVFLAVSINSQTDDWTSSEINGTAIIKLPQVANYRRVTLVRNEEQIFRVCNGKNKKTCGYWENVKTKKKVSTGATSYNKNKKALVIKNIRETDFGDYMTGNKKKSIFLMNKHW